VVDSVNSLELFISLICYTMYAVISLQGHQYIVSEGTELVVDSLSLEEGKKMSIDTVLAVFDEKGSSVKVGTPFVSGAKVEATVGTTQK